MELPPTTPLPLEFFSRVYPPAPSHLCGGLSHPRSAVLGEETELTRALPPFPQTLKCQSSWKSGIDNTYFSILTYSYYNDFQSQIY